MHLIYLYKTDLALNSLKKLIYLKNKEPNQPNPLLMFLFIKFCLDKAQKPQIAYNACSVDQLVPG